VLSLIILWISVEILVESTDDRYLIPPPIKAEFSVIAEGNPSKTYILDSTE